jgi:hypothetical protein
MPKKNPKAISKKGSHSNKSGRATLKKNRKSKNDDVISPFPSPARPEDAVGEQRSDAALFSRKVAYSDVENSQSDREVGKHQSDSDVGKHLDDSDVENPPGREAENQANVSSDSEAEADIEGGSEAGKLPSPGASDADRDDVNSQSARDAQAGSDDDDCFMVEPESNVQVKPALSSPRARAAAPQEQQIAAFTSDAAAATADIARSTKAEAVMLSLEAQLAEATKKASAQRLEQETAQEAVDLLQKSIDEEAKKKREHQVEIAARLLRRVDSSAKKLSAKLPELPLQSQRNDLPLSRSAAYVEWLLRSAIDGREDSGRQPEIPGLSERNRSALLEKVRQLEHAQFADCTEFAQTKENEGFACQKFDLNIEIRELTERAEAAEAKFRPLSVHERLINPE